MSILLDPPTLTRRTTPGKTAFWGMLALLVFFLLNVLAWGPLVARGLDVEEGWWHRAVLSPGPDVIFNRLQVLGVILAAPLFLKKMGWSGLRDVGWRSGQTRGERKKDFLVWMMAGFAAILLSGVIYRFTAPDGWSQGDGPGWLHWIFVDALFRGLVVIILLETAARGVLFRTLQSVWTPWTATLSVSILLAWCKVSSLQPHPFQSGFGALAGSLLSSPFQDGDTFLLFLCHLVVGLVLCRLVFHKGDIWAAVGLHASFTMGFSFLTSYFMNAEAVPDLILRDGFSRFAWKQPWVLVGLLGFWGWMEWVNRKKLTSYGTVRL